MHVTAAAAEAAATDATGRRNRRDEVNTATAAVYEAADADAAAAANSAADGGHEATLSRERLEKEKVDDEWRQTLLGHASSTYLQAIAEIVWVGRGSLRAESGEDGMGGSGEFEGRVG